MYKREYVSAWEVRDGEKRQAVQDVLVFHLKHVVRIIVQHRERVVWSTIHLVDLPSEPS